MQIHETVEQINNIKLQREFFLGFSDNPQKFINEWMASQSRDLKVNQIMCIIQLFRMRKLQGLLTKKKEESS